MFSVYPTQVTKNHFRCKNIPITFSMIHEATTSHPMQQKVMRCHHKKCLNVFRDKIIQPFYPCLVSLAEVVGCFLSTEQVIVLSLLHERVPKKFLRGLQSIRFKKAKERRHAYWPDMNKRSKELVSTCSSFKLAAKSPRKTTLGSFPLLNQFGYALTLIFLGLLFYPPLS